MSDYIRFLTSATAILQHIKIVTIQWKGIGVDEICKDMPQGVYFENKSFHSISIDFIFAQSSPWNYSNFPGMAVMP